MDAGQLDREMSKQTSSVNNLIVIKKGTETSNIKKFKKQESVGLTLAKVKGQDLKKERNKKDDACKSNPSIPTLAALPRTWS